LGGLLRRSLDKARGRRRPGLGRGLRAWVPAARGADAGISAPLRLFTLLEWGIRSASGSAERSRHLGLALAAFTAFNLFYVFAGAPSLRQLPGGTRAAAFVAPLVGTLFLLKRWQRTPEHFIGERGAVRLLRAWPFEEPPPKDPGEVYGWIRASRHAREKDVAAYAATVREMIADGLVRRASVLARRRAAASAF
jgi:hypothetical protein